MGEWITRRWQSESPPPSHCSSTLPRSAAHVADPPIEQILGHHTALLRIQATRAWCSIPAVRSHRASKPKSRSPAAAQPQMATDMPAAHPHGWHSTPGWFHIGDMCGCSSRSGSVLETAQSRPCWVRAIGVGIARCAIHAMTTAHPQPGPSIARSSRPDRPTPVSPPPTPRPAPVPWPGARSTLHYIDHTVHSPSSRCKSGPVRVYRDMNSSSVGDIRWRSRIRQWRSDRVPVHPATAWLPPSLREPTPSTLRSLHHAQRTPTPVQSQSSTMASPRARQIRWTDSWLRSPMRKSPQWTLRDPANARDAPYDPLYWHDSVHTPTRLPVFRSHRGIDSRRYPSPSLSCAVSTNDKSRSPHPLVNLAHSVGQHSGDRVGWSKPRWSARCAPP